MLRYDFQERAWQKEQGKTVGPTVLFFGCRNKEQDYIYRLAFHLRINLLITFSDSGRSWRLGNRMVCSPFTPHSAETRFVSVFTRQKFLVSPAPLYLCSCARLSRGMWLTTWESREARFGNCSTKEPTSMSAGMQRWWQRYKIAKKWLKDIISVFFLRTCETLWRRFAESMEGCRKPTQRPLLRSSKLRSVIQPTFGANLFGAPDWNSAFILTYIWDTHTPMHQLPGALKWEDTWRLWLNKADWNCPE